MYKQGLKPTIRKVLIISRATITTLDKLIDEAIRLDNDLHKLALEEEIYASRSRINRKEPRNVKTHGY
jgi:cell division protein FtsL